MLNDNRKQLGNSRTREHIVARLIGAYPNVPAGLGVPRMIR
jgi:hypothetical protein